MSPPFWGRLKVSKKPRKELHERARLHPPYVFCSWGCSYCLGVNDVNIHGCGQENSLLCLLMQTLDFVTFLSCFMYIMAFFVVRRCYKTLSTSAKKPLLIFMPLTIKVKARNWLKNLRSYSKPPFIYSWDQVHNYISSEWQLLRKMENRMRPLG